MSKKPLKLVVIGAPGAGKGTQAKLLAARLSIPHISSGDLLREHIAAGDEIGVTACSLMKDGNLVPDDIVISLVKEFIEGESFILDGFPRTICQAQTLDGMLAIRGTGIYRVIYVKVDDELIISRMAGRRSCATCGSIYHIVSNPPRFADVCDKCSNSLHVRYDDKADIVRRRIQTYYELTNPIIDHYRKQGLVMQVSGVGDINEIADAITLNLLQ